MSSQNISAGESALDRAAEFLLPMYHPPRNPRILYQVGDILTLTLGADHELAGQELKVSIKKILGMTMSCTLLVDVLSIPYPEPLVLKLFDRRKAQLLRSTSNAPNWTRELEDTYFVSMDKTLSDRIGEWNAKAKTTWDWYLDTDEMDDLVLEAYLQHVSLDMCFHETRAYSHLQHMQGEQIPKFFASVSLPAPSKDGIDDHCFSCKGLLLQYIDGFELEYLAFRAPKDQWQPIMDQVVQTIATWRDMGATNIDISPRNIVVRKPKSGEGFKPFMIDFAGMRFRDQFPNEQEYEDELAHAREETNIAHWMACKLGIDATEGFYEVRVSARGKELEDRWENEFEFGDEDEDEDERVRWQATADVAPTSTQSAPFWTANEVRWETGSNEEDDEDNQDNLPTTLQEGTAAEHNALDDW